MKDVSIIAQSIDDLFASLSVSRRQIAQEEPVAWDDMTKQIEALEQAIQGLPHQEAENLKARLILLADEIRELESLITHQCTDIKSRMQQSHKRHQAVMAYRNQRDR